MEEDSKRLSEEEEGEEEKGLMAFPLIAPLPAPIPTLMAPHPVSVPGAPFPHGAGHGDGDRDPEGSGRGQGAELTPMPSYQRGCAVPAGGLSPRGGMDTGAEGSPLRPPSH